MATKKVEENKKTTKAKTGKAKTTNVKAASAKTSKTKAASVKTTNKKVTNNNVKAKSSTSKTKSSSPKKEKKVVENLKEKEEMVLCPKCHNEYLKSLGECPNCKKAKKVNADDEDYDDDDYDDEEYDDEEEVSVKKKEKVKEEKELKEEVDEIEETPKKKVVKKDISKKDKKKISDSVTGNSFMEQNSEIVSLLKILVGVIIIIGVAYFVIALINGDFKKKDDATDDTNEEVTSEIQNEKILASSIFEKDEEEFYVFVYNSDDSKADYYSMLYSDYKNATGGLPIFWVDLSDKLNSDVVVQKDEKTNKYAQELSELRLESPTLIYMRNHRNKKYREGDDAINRLKELIKELNEKEK